MDTVPGLSEYGQLVRHIGPITVVVAPTVGALANGIETLVSIVAVLVLVANPLRKAAVVQNVGLGNIRVGIAGVTATTGIRIEPGDSIVFEEPYCYQGDVFAVREGGQDSIALTQEIT